MNILKKFALLATVSVLSMPCYAQNTNVNTNEDLQKALNEVNKQMETAVGQMGEVMKENLPKMVDEMTGFINEMMKMMIPMLVSIEENKKLPKADLEMAERIKATMNEKYIQNTDVKINDDINDLIFSGEYEENGTKLRYVIYRSLTVTFMTADLMSKESVTLSQSSKFASNTTVDNLNNEKIPLSKIKTNDINGQQFTGYTDKDKKETYIFTNVGAYLNVSLQANGENYGKVAKDFVDSLDYEALRKAIKDDWKTLPELTKGIESKVKNLRPEEVEQMFQQYQGQ